MEMKNVFKKSLRKIAKHFEKLSVRYYFSDYYLQTSGTYEWFATFRSFGNLRKTVEPNPSRDGRFTGFLITLIIEKKYITLNRVYYEVVIKDLKPNKELLDIADQHIFEQGNIVYVEQYSTNSEDMKPNKELLQIAEKHIQKDNQKNMREGKKTPPATSYGVPDIIVPKPQITDQDLKENKTDKSNSPPATSYGVPDIDIDVKFLTKGLNENKSREHIAIQEARPYNLIGSSYGAPLKSVTSNATSIANETFLSLPISNENNEVKFSAQSGDKNDDDTDTKNSSDTKTEMKRQTQYVMIPMDTFDEFMTCMKKSLNSAYRVKIDGKLTKSTN